MTAQGASQSSRRGASVLRAGLACALLCWTLAETAAAQARSYVAVEGMPAGVSFRPQDILREETEPDSLYEARRQADRAAQTIARYLESEGFYAAQVEPQAEGAAPYRRFVHVDAGRRFTIARREIAWIGGAAPDPDAAVKVQETLAQLHTDEPARAAPVLAVEDAIVAQLKASGYPEAASKPVDALADGRAATVDLTFQIQTGRRASFGEIAASGLVQTKASYLRELKTWKLGDAYSPRKLDEFRRRLVETGLFDSVDLALAAAGANAEPPSQIRDVGVKVTEGKRRTVSLGGFASTSEGGGVEAEWDKRNLTGRGDSISVAARIATLNRRLALTYGRPNTGHYGRNLSVSVAYSDQETTAYDDRGVTLSATVEERLSKLLKSSIGVQAGYDSIVDANGPRDLAEIGATGTVEYTGVANILDPDKGVRARASIEPGLTYGDTTIGFTRLTGEASVYAPLGTPKLIGALRGKIGAIIGPNGAPPDKQFYAGGGGSVRGYEYQTLSPRDSLGKLIGGRSLVETSAEVRWRVTDKLGYVAFIDAGAAGDTSSPPWSDMRSGAGVGVRYFAGFGPLRADVAVPLDRRTGDASFQIYLSIGQAF